MVDAGPEDASVPEPKPGDRVVVDTTDGHALGTVTRINSSLAERREAQHYAAINQQLPRKRDGQWGWLEPGGMTQSAAPVRYNMRPRSTWRG
jgi:hypothetical protein